MLPKEIQATLAGRGIFPLDPAAPYPGVEIEIVPGQDP